jgi:hypothetical protein
VSTAETEQHQHEHDGPAGETGEQGEPLEGADEREPEPEAEPEPEVDELEALAEGRCEAETTVGGSVYRCSLEEGHEGEHSFQALDTGDEPEQAARESAREAQQRIVDEQAKKLDRAEKAYTGKVLDALGAELSGFLPCELCAPFYPGLRLPVPLTAEQTGALRAIVGLPSLETMIQDKYSTVCDDCDGKGKVLTGSAVPQYASTKCLTCKGKGWVPVGDERRLEAHQEVDQPVDQLAADGEEQPDTDPWGRQKGDPDYGRLPGYEA